VYLPDELGERAKKVGLAFSQLLRGAVIEELERMEAMEETLEEVETFEVDIETENLEPAIGRITGALIAQDSEGVQAYLTEDERVLVYDPDHLKVHDVTDDPAEALQSWFDNDQEAYIVAMEAIGETPVIDL
jgi:hypothetical protein